MENNALQNDISLRIKINQVMKRKILIDVFKSIKIKYISLYLWKIIYIIILINA